MSAYSELDDEALLERLRERAGAMGAEYREQPAGDGWLCSFRQFSPIPSGLAPPGPVLLSQQGEDLRATREALLAQAEAE